MERIAIFASGSGSNARVIMDYFKNHKSIRVTLVVSNKMDAPVLEKAKDYGVETLVISREPFYKTDEISKHLQFKGISFIVLAGFLWLIPKSLVTVYPNKIINIHPALLPKFGGKGMYGMNVHRAVVESGETESGITIHYVNEEYDEGNIIFQAKCTVLDTQTTEEVQQNVLKLEHQHYPKVIEKLLLDR